MANTAAAATATPGKQQTGSSGSGPAKARFAAVLNARGEKGKAGGDVRKNVALPAPMPQTGPRQGEDQAMMTDLMTGDTTPALTCIFAAVAALLNLWLGFRCGQVRSSAKISHGDGGNPLLARRMRAQLNFAENTPIVLVLFLGLELCGMIPDLWLAILAAVYIAARVAHALGMDADSDSKGRMAGVALTMVVTVALALMALYCGYTMLDDDVEAPASVGAPV